MTKKILFVGVDIDDKAFHIAGFDPMKENFIEFVSKPNSGSLLIKLKKYQAANYKINVCYEASYIGYNLCRFLRAHDIDCDIVAPSKIPTMPGRKVKTDRLDSRKLGEYYSKKLLTVVNMPSEEDEEVRCVIRTRSFLVKERSNLKRHILSTCRFFNLDYHQEVGKVNNHWTDKHLNWLNKKISELSETLRLNFESLLSNLVQYDLQIKKYDDMVAEFSKLACYSRQCQALVALKGVKTLTALTLTVEVGDIRRFNHPKNLASYTGMDIAEYTSGGKEKKFGMTKQGNKHIRTAVIESCQTIGRGTDVGKVLRLRREKIDPEIVEIAVRCQMRLSKKKQSLLQRGKHPNLVKTACAREMIGFIWEILSKVA